MTQPLATGADAAMSDAELIECVKAFRDEILDGDSSFGRCAMVCWPLAGFLQFLGIGARIAETPTIELSFCITNHVFIVLDDGRVLDPTADQFSTSRRKLPPVYLGKPLKRFHAAGAA